MLEILLDKLPQNSVKQIYCGQSIFKTCIPPLPQGEYFVVLVPVVKVILFLCISCSIHVSNEHLRIPMWTQKSILFKTRFGFERAAIEVGFFSFQMNILGQGKHAFPPLIFKEVKFQLNLMSPTHENDSIPTISYSYMYVEVVLWISVSRFAP